MKRLAALLFIGICVFGCDQMQKPVMDLVDEVVAPDPEPTVDVPPAPEVTPPVEVPPPAPIIATITYENALSLEAGEKYRLRPDEMWTSTGPRENRQIRSLVWTNIDVSGNLLDRGNPPPDAPKIVVMISLDPPPYKYTTDGEAVIAEEDFFDGVNLVTVYSDEVVIEISRIANQEERKIGERGNKVPYTHIRYFGKIVENLTRPDVVFEYE